MYIAVYPVALSIRSTNVYEERSLGVFEAPEEDDDDEPDVVSTLLDSRSRDEALAIRIPVVRHLRTSLLTPFIGRPGHARTRTARARRSVRRMAPEEAGVCR